MLFSGPFDEREINVERGAASKFALHHDVSASLLHDSIHGRQAKPGPFAFFLRREERLKDSRLSLAVHPRPRINDGKHHVSAGTDEVLPTPMMFVNNGVLRLNGEP